MDSESAQTTVGPRYSKKSTATLASGIDLIRPP